MSGRPPSAAATAEGADAKLCRDALRAIAAERAFRARRRREASPTQAGFLVGQLMEAKVGSANLAGVMAELVELGPRGLEELVARFPGPLWRDPRVDRSELPTASQIGPLTMALSCFGPRARPVIVGLLQSHDPEDRLCGAAIAPAFPGDEVVRAVTALCLHGDSDARRMAVRALHAMASCPFYADALAQLRGTWLDEGARTPTRVRALRALAQLGDATLVPGLVELLAVRSPELVDAVHDALCTLTAHDFGRQPMLWRVWLSRRGSQPRHFWLLRGLHARRERLRHHALRGLSRLLGRPLDAGPQADRRQCLALAHELTLELGSLP